MLVFSCLRFCVQNRKMWVYIDESGNLGSKGKFFLLAAVVCSNDKVKKKIKNMIRSAKVRFADEEKVLDEENIKVRSDPNTFEQIKKEYKDKTLNYHK